MGQRITTSGSANVAPDEPLGVHGSVVEAALLNLLSEAFKLGGDDQVIESVSVSRQESLQSWGASGGVLYELELVTELT